MDPVDLEKKLNSSPYSIPRVRSACHRLVTAGALVITSDEVNVEDGIRVRADSKGRLRLVIVEGNTADEFVSAEGHAPDDVATTLFGLLS